jgi:hypothetical protein
MPRKQQHNGSDEVMQSDPIWHREANTPYQKLAEAA